MPSHFIQYEYVPWGSGYPKPIYGSRDGTLSIPRDDMIVLTPDRNTHGKRDFTGAFKPEAERFAKLHAIPETQIHRIDVSKSMRDRAEQTLEILEREVPTSVIALFCHGYATGVQLGFRSSKSKAFTKVDERNLHDLVNLVAKNVVFVLYACSTGDDPAMREEERDPDSAPGSGDYSFGDLLRDRLCENDSRACRVFTHTTVGHATKNPYVKFFDGEYSYVGGVGAKYVVRPGTSMFRKFRDALWKDDDFRFRVPFMDVVDIQQALASSQIP